MKFECVQYIVKEKEEAKKDNRKKCYKKVEVIVRKNASRFQYNKTWKERSLVPRKDLSGFKGGFKMEQF